MYENEGAGIYMTPMIAKQFTKTLEKRFVYSLYI